MFERYLVCTDLVDGLHRLVKFVPSLAAGGMKQIVFLHSVPYWQQGQIPREDTKKMDQARDRLSAALENVPDGIEVAVEVRPGKPVDNILHCAKAHKSDLILLGASNRSLLTEKLFGSTTIDLSGRTKIPIMTLPTSMISSFTAEELELRCQHLYRDVLIPYDGSDISNHLLKEFKRYVEKGAKGSLERCTLAWVVYAGGRRDVPKDHQLKEAQQKLESIRADLEPLDLKVTLEVRLGEPVKEILDMAALSDICAIAISSGSLGKIWELPLSSFTGEVLRDSCQPVIFFPSAH